MGRHQADLHQLEEGAEGADHSLAGRHVAHGVHEVLEGRAARATADGGPDGLYVPTKGSRVALDGVRPARQGLPHQPREGGEQVPGADLSEVVAALRLVIGDLAAIPPGVLQGAPVEAVLKIVGGALEAAILDQALDQLVLGIEVVFQLDLLAGQERP